MKTRTRRTVWVPFEMLPDKTERKCNDLPRFATIGEVREYLRIHNQRLSARLLQWREHSEKEYIEEYEAGVGTLKILLL
jgi:hypothetical protein